MSGLHALLPNDAIVFIPSMLWPLTPTFWSYPGITPDLIVKGEVGGEATISCPFDKKRAVEFFYLQKNGAYVNGFHRWDDLSGTPTWKNTRLDQHQKTTVHMFDLKASQGGVYRCIIRYGGIRRRDETNVHLRVTGMNDLNPQNNFDCFAFMVLVSHNT